MEEKKLLNTMGDLAIERIAALLADRVADRVVTALMEAGFDKRLAEGLLRALEKELKETKGK